MNFSYLYKNIKKQEELKQDLADIINTIPKNLYLQGIPTSQQFSKS